MSTTTSRPVNVSQVRHVSPFRYPGGKTWLVPTAREWLNKIGNPELLLEPFAGGAAIGLAAGVERLAEKIELIEMDDNVAAVWNVALEAPIESLEDLLHRIETFDMTPENVHSILGEDPKDPAARAFRTIIQNRCQRGGIMAPGAGLMKAGENGKGLASRWYPSTLIKRFRIIQGLRGRVTFTHGDAFAAIQSNPGAAVFVDPPYTAAGKKAGARLYAHHQLDHGELFATVAEHSGPALMTYDDTPEVRDLADFYGFTISTVPMKSGHHAVMRELVLTRD